MSPRGNDAEEARAELEKSEGIAPNAEDIITANKDRYTPELRAANNKSINDEATQDLDLSKVEGAVPDGHEVADYAVRGDHVVIVHVDESGRSGKIAVPLEDVGGPSKSKARKTESKQELDEQVRAKSKQSEKAAQSDDKS